MVDTTYSKVFHRANQLYESGKYDRAVQYLDSATCRFKNLNISQKFDYYNFTCNYLFHYKHDNNRSMLYADSMLRLFNTPQIKSKYMTIYSKALFAKGDVLFEQKKYNDAYHYFYRGKLVAKQDAKDCTLSDYSYRMGMIMYEQENYALAEINFKNSSKETNSCDLTFLSFYRRQELLDNIGLSYSKINQGDSALRYYQKALDFIDEKANLFGDRAPLLDVARGVIYGNKADVYITKRNFAAAKALLKKSSAINLRKGNDNQDAQYSEIKLAQVYYKTNEIDSLIDLLHHLRTQLDSVKNQEAEADWTFLMANYLNKRGKTQDAVDYFIKYDIQKDSITSRNKKLKEADIEQEIKQIEKDHAFNDLKKDNRAQNFYLKFVSLSGVMLLVIIALILLNWRKSRKNITVLGGLNKQINEQNQTLEDALTK